jgi:hypothetical protein
MSFLPATQPHDTIKLMAAYLSHSARLSDGRQSPVLQRFMARSVPSIDIHGYLARILKYAPCGTECFLAVLVYFDRMAAARIPKFLSKTTLPIPKDSPLVINSFNIHRLLIIGVMVAVKFMSDVFYTNVHVSRIFND